MSGNLHLLCCRNFLAEIEATIAAEGWTDVTVAPFPAHCGHPPTSWDELRPLVSAACTQTAIIGNACLKDLREPPASWPPVWQWRNAECFELVAGGTLVGEALARGCYLVTPGWLADWRGRLLHMGFDEKNASDFFRDSVRELLFLDTGVAAEATRQFAEFAQVTGLPATRLAVGIDYVRQGLARRVAAWRLEEARRTAVERDGEHARELANHKTAMDFLGRLPLTNNERETVAAIEEMFHLLFAPREFHFVRTEANSVVFDGRLPPELTGQVQALKDDWSWTTTGTGFLLRIARGGELLGIIVADGFAFPEYRDRYLNLALSIAGVAGLAIDNARSYRRTKDAEEALRKSERSLMMAQAMAHLGHWELDIGTQNIRWSDETYRILGHDPKTFVPSYDAFLQSIHPADRPLVASQIDAVTENGSFDAEFRIVLPNGRLRVLHGMAELIHLGVDQPQIIGTLRDITVPAQKELLGVIQDITERKELQDRLEREARTDPLTGCTNRRYFLDLAAHEVARAHRYVEEVSVLMLDLDHFKEINDLHGHAAGDLVLQRLVEVCHATLRTEDVVGRLGGEEFAVLMPETGNARALEVAERLCRALAGTDVRQEDKPALRFTASIGVATLTPQDTNFSAVLRRADRALYDAKRTGRNRAVTA